jgi:hypothetical protein
MRRIIIFEGNKLYFLEKRNPSLSSRPPIGVAAQPIYGAGGGRTTLGTSHGDRTTPGQMGVVSWVVEPLLCGPKGSFFLLLLLF